MGVVVVAVMAWQSYQQQHLGVVINNILRVLIIKYLKAIS